MAFQPIFECKLARSMEEIHENKQQGDKKGISTGLLYVIIHQIVDLLNSLIIADLY